MKTFFKHKRLIIILSILLVIIVTTSNIFSWYLKNLTPKINLVVENKLEKVTYEIIMSKIDNTFLEEGNLEDILEITRNSDGEILTVDYNLEKAYEVNNLINNKIRDSLYNLEEGDYLSSDFKLGNNSMYIDVPMFISSNYVILSSLGPKIPIKVSFIGTLVTNLKTKVTSYGLNNALAEIYVVVEVTELITTPVTEKEVKVKYDILINAIMINGRVPYFYGNDITKEGNILDIPL